MASSSSTSESPDLDQEIDEASELVEYKAMSASIPNISDCQLGIFNKEWNLKAIGRKFTPDPLTGEVELTDMIR